MEGLYNVWPMRIERLAVMGHNMGGLVARSAIHHSALIQRGALRWPGRVDDLIFLGTPHHGVPVDRIGPGLDLLLGATPYASSLARLGKVRSAGIHDLRFGNILRRPAGNDDVGQADAVGLPGGTRCYAIAASLAPRPGSLKTDVGDGLVPVASALGQHDDPALSLAFEPERQAVIADTGHLSLLSSTEVAALLGQWLG
nr:GPI inositol-deacylase [Pelomonas sp. P8]